MNLIELKRRREKIIKVAIWCFENRGLLTDRKEQYISSFNAYLKDIFSDIIDAEKGEKIIYDQLIRVPIIFERYNNDLKLCEHREEIIETIYGTIINYAQEIYKQNIQGNPDAPGESGGR